MNIAIIPARGGSKRIPRKNVKDFCGKPMIAWSIEKAKKSGLFDRIVVSTEDEKIAEIAEEHGAETPFQRPAELADDQAATAPVIAHAVKALDLAPDTPVCCIYAASPLIQVLDLRASRKLLDNIPSGFVLPVTTFAYPIQRALRQDLSSGQVSLMNPGLSDTRSQDLEEAWHDAGQFCWGFAKSWMSNKGIFSQKCIGYPIPRHRVQDIDTLEDWNMAERLAACWRNQSP